MPYTPPTIDLLGLEIARVRGGRDLTSNDLADRLGPWLRDHDARVWDEGCEAAEQYYVRTVVHPQSHDPLPMPKNPYRVEGGENR